MGGVRKMIGKSATTCQVKNGKKGLKQKLFEKESTIKIFF
jgi:hypothetical protein